MVPNRTTRSTLVVAALASLLACKSSKTAAPPPQQPSNETSTVTPEEAAQALLDGKDASRFLDPAFGIVQFPAGVVCGADVDAAIRSTVAAMKEDLAGGATLTCETDDAGSTACNTSPDMEGDEGHGVRFVVDAAGGLRLAGLEVYEAGTGGTDFYEQSFDEYLAAIAAAPRC